MPARGFMRNFRPLEILTEEQMESIHRGSLDVLEHTGIRFESEKALKLFEKNGCKVDFENKRVRFPPGLVEECLRRCPTSFHLRARNPKNDLNLSANNPTYFCVFPGMRTVDIDTWEPRTPTIEENHNAVKVLDSLEHVHLSVSYVPYCELEGVAPAMLLPTSCWSRMKYFTKPFRVGQAEESWLWGIQMAQVLDIDVFGSFESAPPLTWYGDAIECAWAHAEAGFPIEVGCGAVLGGTGPATFAGGLVASNAEMMSGIVLVQLLRPGLGTIANCFVFPQNMRTGAPGFGQIGISLFQAGYTQMWRAKYGLPTLLGACGPMASKLPDAQYGYEKAMACTIGALSGGSIINAIGGLHGELTYHPVVSVLDNDMAGMIGRFLEGLHVNEETLALDLIQQVGPIPGFFLGESHTRENWHKEQFVPQVFDQLTYTEWQAAGKKSAIDNAKERVNELIANYEHDLPEDKEVELDRILEEAKHYYHKKGLM
ncbi:MAG TPA: trimethylamine methyltransferase family protein [candidate division Zixibacteria bacterium]|nr:trimethylamine methyltransferase family protein [candidate division Zixibacteria bacterium]